MILSDGEEEQQQQKPLIVDYKIAGCDSEIHYFYTHQDWKNFELKLNGLIGWVCREWFPNIRQRSENYKDIQSAARVKVMSALLEGKPPYDPTKGTFVTFLYSLSKNAIALKIYHENRDRKYLSYVVDENIAQINQYQKYKKQLDHILEQYEVPKEDHPAVISYFLDKNTRYKNMVVLRSVSWALYLNNFSGVNNE